MNWALTVLKAFKYAGIVLLAGILEHLLAPGTLSNALAQLPFGLGAILTGVLTGLIAAALNAVKHWNDE